MQRRDHRGQILGPQGFGQQDALAGDAIMPEALVLPLGLTIGLVLTGELGLTGGSGLGSALLGGFDAGHGRTPFRATGHR